MKRSIVFAKICAPDMADSFKVRLTRAALADLDEIGDHMAQLRGLDETETLLAHLYEHAGRLAQFPLRGPVPKELDGIGRTDVRQTAFDSYRIFYKVGDAVVNIFMVVDGRRDIDTLLTARLID